MNKLTFKSNTTTHSLSKIPKCIYPTKSILATLIQPNINHYRYKTYKKNMMLILIEVYFLVQCLIYEASIFDIVHGSTSAIKASRERRRAHAGRDSRSSSDWFSLASVKYSLKLYVAMRRLGDRVEHVYCDEQEGLERLCIIYIQIYIYEIRNLSRSLVLCGGTLFVLE